MVYSVVESARRGEVAIGYRQSNSSGGKSDVLRVNPPKSSSVTFGPRGSRHRRRGRLSPIHQHCRSDASASREGGSSMNFRNDNRSRRHPRLKAPGVRRAFVQGAQQHRQQDHQQILVSEDGEKFGHFDIGAGIPAGKTVTLVWDQSTNGEGCEQTFKAVFANSETSEPQEFDFCESEVEIEFE